VAVYTDISDSDLREFLTAYDVGGLTSVIGIAEGVENSNYLLITERGRYILTIYEKRVRREDLPFFLGLMDHLSRNGVACPTPVPARDGTILQEIAGKPVAMVTFLEGVWPRRVWLEHCQALGTAIADPPAFGRCLKRPARGPTRSCPVSPPLSTQKSASSNRVGRRTCRPA
jgi:homoserine kinase type II